MSEIHQINGTITGNLIQTSTIQGTLTNSLNMSGRLTVPKSVGEKDYGRLINKPIINGHELQSGENSLEDLSIDLAPRSAIDNLFRF